VKATDLPLAGYIHNIHQIHTGAYEGVKEASPGDHLAHLKFPDGE
jgi:hypothetical protein